MEPRTRKNMALIPAFANNYSSGVKDLMGVIDLKEKEPYTDPSVTFEKMRSQLFSDKKNDALFSLLRSAIFLRGTRNADVTVVKKILNSSRKEYASCAEILCVQCVARQFRLQVMQYYKETPQGSCITFGDWLEGFYAAEELQCFEILDQLFKFEKIVCGRNTCGWTVLHLAVLNCLPQLGDSEVKAVEILLESGRFDVNALTEEKETVLHFACCCKALSGKDKGWYKYYDNLKELFLIILKHKVDINRTNLARQTALMFACINENVVSVREIIEWDLRNGLTLDVEVKDINGQTALSLLDNQAAEERFFAMIKSKIFLTAVKNGDMDILNIYVNISKDEYERKGFRNSDHGKEVFKNIRERFKTHEVWTFESRPFVSHSVMLEAVLIAHSESNDSILKLLLLDDRFTGAIRSSPTFKSIMPKLERANEKIQTDLKFKTIVLPNLAKLEKNYRYPLLETFHGTVFQLALEEYVGTDEEDSPMLQKIKIFLKFDDSSYRKEKMLEMICRSFPDMSMKRNRFVSRIKVILRLLIESESGVDVNLRNTDGETPLMIACEHGYVDTVRSLLKFARKSRIHVEIDAIDNSGETALTKAKRTDDKRILGVLKESDFLAAVRREEKDLVKSFLDKAENGIAKFTKSLGAMQYTDYHECSMLIECGIDFDTWIEAVQITIRNSSKEILELLLNYNIIVQNQECKVGDTILHRIFNERDNYDHDLLQLIEVLLESGKVNVNALNFQAETVLHSMFESCHGNFDSHCQENHNDVIYDAIKLLLSFGANVNQRDINGRTPLILTSKYGCAGSMQAILNWSNQTNTRLELDAQDFRGRTALIEAVIRGDYSMVEMLLSFGASINLSDRRGFTALHHALCKAFISRKWSIFGDYQPEFNSWIDFGDFPRDPVELRKMKEMNITLIQNMGRNQNNTNIESKLDKGFISIVELLLASGDVDVNVLQCNGFSPLDIVEASMVDIPFSIRDSLKKKGAISYVYQSPSNQIKKKSDFDIGCVNFVLHRLATAEIFPTLRRTQIIGDRVPEILSELSKTLEKLGKAFHKSSATVLKEIVSSKDGKGRTSLHYAVIMSEIVFTNPYVHQTWNRVTF